MFDPHYCYDSDDQERLYAIGLEVYKLTKDEDIALPIIKSAADHGWSEAARFLARYWLAKTKYPDPCIWRGKIDYRKAAEFALTAHDYALLQECYDNCVPGELDDIKARSKAHCKNYDPVRRICLVCQAECGDVERDWCEHLSYTEI